MATYLMTHYDPKAAPVVYVHTVWYVNEYGDHVLYGIYSDHDQAHAEHARQKTFFAESWMRTIEVIQPPSPRSTLCV